MARGDLSDTEWELIGPMLSPGRGRGARPAGVNRRFAKVWGRTLVQ